MFSGFSGFSRKLGIKGGRAGRISLCMRFEGSRGDYDVRDTNYGIIMAIGGGLDSD